MSSFSSAPQGSPPFLHPPLPIQGSSLKESWDVYQARYNESITNSDEFWTVEANKYLSWFSPFTKVSDGGFAQGDVNWFSNGKLNVCYNCVDKHLPEKADKVAIIWEGDEQTESRSITYRELQQEICRIANVMKSHGVQKGDVVTLYMPMIPELAMTMLACARIGAIHSIVFAGFSADSLRGRLEDCNSRFIFTADEGKRGGKNLKLKVLVDEAIANLTSIRHVFVYRRTHTPSLVMNTVHNRDVDMSVVMLTERPYCPCVWVDSEDELFILYTSGSTGKPKGVSHSSAGYLLFAAMTCDCTFDLRVDDVFCCVADCGWITGHSYIVYGPLCNGCTTVMFESIPTYPNPYRYWDLVQKHKVTQFYTAPTAIRTLMRFDTAPIALHDLSSLRVIGSVGEPINPAAWSWYSEHVGRGVCTVVDTYWQTETGGHVATNLPGAAPMKPGSCALPYFGIDFAVLDPKSGEELIGNNVEGVLCIRNSWPGIARTVYGDHDRFLSIYLRPYPGFYFTGDGCRRDDDGYYWITGRVDDVINPSGHRIGTAEIESALVATTAVSEAAVVGFPHAVKGEGIACFVILKEGHHPSSELSSQLKAAVRAAIGPIATPDMLIFSDLPKTRSGKIMRRVLRKIAAGEVESIGDTSTLADPDVVARLITLFNEQLVN